MKYLIRTVETYRVENEDEAKKVIEEAKKDKAYTLSKYSSEYRCTKSKGEITDDWYRVILTKDFNTEKEPDSSVDVTYETVPGFFPEPVVETVMKQYSEEENEGEIF